jgi:hypothetical protein
MTSREMLRALEPFVSFSILVELSIMILTLNVFITMVVFCSHVRTVSFV